MYIKSQYSLLIFLLWIFITFACRGKRSFRILSAYGGLWLQNVASLSMPKYTKNVNAIFIHKNVKKKIMHIVFCFGDYFLRFFMIFNQIGKWAVCLINSLHDNIQTMYIFTNYTTLLYIHQHYKTFRGTLVQAAAIKNI